MAPRGMHFTVPHTCHEVIRGTATTIDRSQCFACFHMLLRTRSHRPHLLTVLFYISAAGSRTRASSGNNDYMIVRKPTHVAIASVRVDEVRIMTIADSARASQVKRATLTDIPGVITAVSAATSVTTLLRKGRNVDSSSITTSRDIIPIVMLVSAMVMEVVPAVRVEQSKHADCNDTIGDVNCTTSRSSFHSHAHRNISVGSMPLRTAHICLFLVLLYGFTVNLPPTV